MFQKIKYFLRRREKGHYGQATLSDAEFMEKRQEAVQQLRALSRQASADTNSIGSRV